MFGSSSTSGLDRTRRKTMLFSRIGPAVTLVLVFLMNFLGRWIYSPLLLPIRQDLGFSYGQMGSLFLFITLGYAVTVLFSGYFARAFRNRGAILTSAFGAALATVLVSLSASLWSLRLGLLLLGSFSGLYMASAMATLTDLIPEHHWGKAMALHEVAPIVALLGAPLVVNLLMSTMDWRSILRILALASFAVATLLLPWRDLGRTRGQAPNFRFLREILPNTRFWLILLGFATAVGAEVGTYAILPAFLSTERGIPVEEVNRLVGFSRLTALGVVLVSGHLRDLFGDRVVMVGALGLAGVATLVMGLATGSLLIAAVWVQPGVVAAFFPSALTALAGASPPGARNVAFSLVFPPAYLLGAGVVPTVLGYLGQSGGFGLGLIALGSWSLLVVALNLFVYRGAQNGKIPSATT